MKPERFRQLEELCHSTRDLESVERGAFLAEACRGDEELRHEVESMLAQDSLDGVMERPPLEVAAELLADSTVTQMPAGTRLGPYPIEGSLGAGGMGEVYRAVDTRLNRKVDIKIAAKQFTERFEREARGELVRGVAAEGAGGEEVMSLSGRHTSGSGAPQLRVLFLQFLQS